MRILHRGDMWLEIQHTDGVLHFDPTEPPAATHDTVVTGRWPEQLSGVRAAQRSGMAPRVESSAAVLDWLSTKGEIHTIQNVAIDLHPYTPIPWATPAEAVRKAIAVLTRPHLAVRRLITHLPGGPQGDPVAVGLTLPDGRRLLHLQLSLHANTPERWLADMVARYRGVDWLVVGVDYEEEAAVVERVARFEARVVLVTDLLSEIRQRVGLPSHIVTPTVDDLAARGVPAMALAPGASMLFEP